MEMGRVGSSVGKAVAKVPLVGEGEAVREGVGVRRPAAGAPIVPATREAISSGERVSPASPTTSVDRAAIVPESAVS